MSDSVTLTRAELREGIAVFLGWEMRKDWGCLCPIGYPSPTQEETDLYGAPGLDFETIREFQLERLRATGKSLRVVSNGTPIFPDPLSDIAQAWNLWQWMIDKTPEDSEEEDRRIDAVFLEWGRENVQCMSATDAALWVCCTVYWAVEGVRVEVKEEAGRTALDGAEGED